jgi:mannose-6-phosphate isomerase-like protein (cupin superfamily)/heme-degrading monooxygenase HmoA
MNKLFALLFTVLTVSASAQAPATKSRVVHNDPSKLRQQPNVHRGAGTMAFGQLVGTQQVSTNLAYLHAGLLNGKSSIGHHFHNNMEEMFVILTGEAEFTINGRTSLIKAPAIVPCRLNNSHAVYNPGTEPVKWMNFGVTMVRGHNDNFDLGDTRVGAALDPIPTFISGRLEKDKARANAAYGTGVLQRRIFNTDVFKTNWDHVDHIIIPAGVTTASRTMDGMEEIYYVVKGSGTVDINGTKTPFGADDATYALVNEKVTFANTGTDDVELLVVGIGTSKVLAAAGPRGGGPGGPGAAVGATGPGAAAPATKGMSLQMDFIVTPEKAAAFEKMYTEVYVPALKQQKGYLGSKLYRLYAPALAKQIQAEATTYNYQLQIFFDTEANRMNWVRSDIHQKTAWPSAAKLADDHYKWRGYDVVDDNDNR